jgi:hypothetical protein
MACKEQQQTLTHNRALRLVHPDVLLTGLLAVRAAAQLPLTMQLLSTLSTQHQVAARNQQHIAAPLRTHQTQLRALAAAASIPCC